MSGSRSLAIYTQNWQGGIKDGSAGCLPQRGLEAGPKESRWQQLALRRPWEDGKTLLPAEAMVTSHVQEGDAEGEVRAESTGRARCRAGYETRNPGSRTLTRRHWDEGSSKTLLVALALGQDVEMGLWVESAGHGTRVV